MKSFKSVRIITLLFATICIVLFCTACSSEKTLDLLLSQPMSIYGSDVSIETAVNNLFDTPSWGTGDGSVDSNNQKRNALSGKSRIGDNWVVHFFCDADDPSDWSAEVQVFSTAEGYYASFLDEYGSDLLMRYLATGDECYRYAFLGIYCCGDPAEKSYDILDLYKYIEVTPTEKAETFIKKYDELFPKPLDSIGVMDYLPGELIDLELDVGSVWRNIDRYGDKLIPARKLTVVDIIEETADENQYVTQINAYDEDFRFYLLLYCGELPEVDVDDVISALVLPVGKDTLTNGLGGQTEYLYLLASTVTAGSDLGEIYDFVATPEERYDAALSYIEMVAAQDALYDVPFSPEAVPDENDTDSGEDAEYSLSWECGYSRGYADGWAYLEYNDDPASCEEAVESAEDYMAGYESGYMAARYDAVNHYSDSDGDMGSDIGQTELSEMVAEFQRAGYASANVLSLLYESTPETFTFTSARKETCLSPLSSSKPNDSNYEGYDNLFNWEYPTAFRSEREEVFELLSRIDGSVFQVSNGEIINNDEIILVEKCGYGSYQRIAPYGETSRATYFYYGDLSNNRPNGIGVLLQEVEFSYGIVPVYAGHFEDGVIKGYGLCLLDNRSDVARFNGIKSEGYFDYTTEPREEGPFGTEGSYGNLQGEGIVYYNVLFDVSNYALLDIIDEGKSELDYDEMMDPNLETEYLVITNYPVQRPKVQYEGTFKNGNLLEGTEYYIEDMCYGTVRSYGSFCYDVIYNGVFVCPDGTCLNGAFSDFSEFIGGIYCPSGNIQFVGTLSGFDRSPEYLYAMYEMGAELSVEDFCYDDGTLYGEDGTIQGTIKDGKFTWS